MNFDDCKITNDVIQAEGFHNKLKFPASGYTEDSARDALDNLVEKGVAVKYNSLIGKLNEAPIGKIVYGDWTKLNFLDNYSRVEGLKGKKIQFRFTNGGSSSPRIHYSANIEIPNNFSYDDNESIQVEILDFQSSITLSMSVDYQIFVILINAVGGNNVDIRMLYWNYGSTSAHLYSPTTLYYRIVE